MTPATFAPATLGAAVQHWRRVRKLHQRQLAAEVGRSQSWLSDIEQDRKSPRVSDLTDIAKVLRVQLTQLLPPAVRGDDE